MRIIEVTSCCDCPYRHHEYPSNIHGWEPDYIYCNKYEKNLADYKVRIITRPVKINAVTQDVTPEVDEWKFSADGETVWDGKIPEWCKLKEGCN